MSSWSLKSIPPHDWYLCLDVDSYFDHEHHPENMFEEGYTRPIPLENRDIIVSIYFNGEVDTPEFNIESKESLSKDDIKIANKSISKILGTEMDIRPLYDQAVHDLILRDKLSSLYGLKRMSRANLFEDIQNRIVEMQMNHKPTAKKMMYAIRKTYGTSLDYMGETLASWPKPFQLMSAEPMNIRKLGPTLRKGQYLVELANKIVCGETDIDFLTKTDPLTAYNTLIKIKGIGPTAAQDIIMMRGRTDAIFPSNIQKGEEKGLRRWLIWSYGGDPNKCTDDEFQDYIKNWKGFESSALEFLYVNWILTEKEKKIAKNK